MDGMDNGFRVHPDDRSRTRGQKRLPGQEAKGFIGKQELGSILSNEING